MSLDSRKVATPFDLVASSGRLHLPRNISGTSERYTIVEALDSGHPFERFEAKREGTPVRVERLSDAVQLFEAADRAIRDELSRATKLRLPGIVEVLDHGVLDGRPFIARPNVTDLHLGELHRVAPAEISMHVIATAARSLDRAHASGVVHGTLRVEDLLIARDGNVRVDGLGRYFAESAASGTIAGEHEVLGPLPPEINLELEPDARADVFGLAAILAAILSSEPIRRAVDGVRLGPLPDDLRDVLTRSTALERDQRLSSCGELAARISEVLAIRLSNGARRRELREFLEGWRAKRERGEPKPLSAMELPHLDSVYRAARDDEIATVDGSGLLAPPAPSHLEVATADEDLPAPMIPRIRQNIGPSTRPESPEKPKRRSGTEATADGTEGDHRIGQLIRGYRVESVIGVGSFATVYAATHEILGSRCAVKVLTASETPDAAERLVREAKFLSRVSHPNLVSLFDCGKTDDGLPFLSMELLEGRTLGNLIKLEAPLPPQRVLELGRQIASGLGAAHAEGLVHRDLKPANVMIGPGDRVKVLDFGIARAFLGDHEALTRVGQIVGTPMYMAPEQIVGTSTVGPPSDLYSLGVVMYAMLSGEPPFIGGIAELLEQHVNASPEPAPEASGVGPLVMSLLQKDPSKRPQTAAEVLTRMDALRIQWTDSARRSAYATGGPSTAVIIIAASALILVLAIAALVYL
ncbi:MAG: protein kinase [Deltaproteobacteria bacterium]|nr:protein kinase [Deltaproteobacteria bacterium]